MRSFHRHAAASAAVLSACLLILSTTTSASATKFSSSSDAAFLTPPQLQRQRQQRRVSAVSSESRSSWALSYSSPLSSSPTAPTSAQRRLHRPETSTVLEATRAVVERSAPPRSKREDGGGSGRGSAGVGGGGGGGGGGGSNNGWKDVRATASSDGRTVEREIVRLGRIGRTDDALRLYRSVWDLDDSSADNEAKRGRTRGRDGAVPTTRLMNVAIDACARARPVRLDDAFRIWREGMDGLGGGAAGRSEERGRGRRRRRRLSPNVFTFGALMSACARARDAEGAIELLGTMQDKYDVIPNAVVYSTAISACERSVPPRPDDALNLLREATSDPTVGMSVVGYNAALSALARAGEWRKAVRLLEEMEGGCEDGEVCSLLDDDDEGVCDVDDEMDESETTGTTRASRGANPPPPLLDPTVPKACPDEITYGTVMAACERSEEWTMVLRYAQALRERAMSDPAFEMDGVTLTTALHACQRLGRCDDALEYLDMMKVLGRREEEGDGSGNDDDDARANGNRRGGGGRGRGRVTNGRYRPGSRAPLLGPDAVAYRLAISACARSRDKERWADGIRLLNEMREVTGSHPDVVAYTAAIGGCAEAGMAHVAFQLLEKMGREGVQPNVVTYNAAIRACATASANAAAEWGGGDVEAARADRAVREPMEEALGLLDRMRTGDDIAVRPDIVTYNAAIRACAEGLNVRGALDLMDELRSDGLVPTVVTYGSLMTACERVGCVTCASRVFQMLKEHSQSDDTLRANEIIYGAAISCCRKAGERERTLLLLKKMLTEGLRPNTATFNTVLMAQTEGKGRKKKPGEEDKDLDRAALVYKLMGTKKYAPNAKPNRQTYSILIRAFASALRPNDAETFLGKMREDGLAPDVDLYTATVTSYERTKQPMKALRLMEAMREDGYDFYEVKVLDGAFKKAVELVNVVGQGLSPSSSGGDEGDAQEGRISDVDGDVDVDMLSSGP